MQMFILIEKQIHPGLSLFGPAGTTASDSTSFPLLPPSPSLCAALLPLCTTTGLFARLPLIPL